MAVPLGSQLRRSYRRVVRDYRADPYLRYILLGALLLSGFFFWHLIPNFATRDERDRIFDVLYWYGSVIETPTIESARAGVVWGRVPFGPTFYLYGLLFLPIVAIVVLTGNESILTAFASPDPYFIWHSTWSATPEWFWMVTIGIVRLSSVAFSVGIVYLGYRIGTTVRDRPTGRLAAIFLTLTLGILMLAHEGGEDIPALFFYLLSTYCAIWYVSTGDRDSFIAASVAGGLAIGFKLTTAPVVGVIGLAFFLRGVNRDGDVREIARPGLLLSGALLGCLTIVASYPDVFAVGPEPLVKRILHGASVGPSRDFGPTAERWWWYGRALFNGQGLVLSIASLSALVALPFSWRDRSFETLSSAIVVAGAVGSLLLFADWHDFRMHHLVPAMALLAIVLAIALARLRSRAPAVGRVILAVLVLTSGVYATAGVLGYGSQPRGEAADWLAVNADENETVELYRHDWQEAGLALDTSVSSPNGRGTYGTDRTSGCPTYIQLGYRDLYYLDSDTFRKDDPERSQYIRALLSNRTQYRTVATFGERPPVAEIAPSNPNSVRDLIRVGLTPLVAQYGDEQEVGTEQYIVILKRQGSCPSVWNPPF